ncbi:MAG: type VI secretion system ATPase TssH [Rhodothermales bacterium]
MPDLKTLIGKLNKTGRRAMEEAAGLCVAQTHYNVEVEHFLLKLNEIDDTDLGQILRYYEVDQGAVATALTTTMEGFKRGNSRTTTLSPHLVKLLEKAWLVSSLHLGAKTVRSGAVLFALLDDESLRGMIGESCPPLREIPRERFKKDIQELVKGTREDETEHAEEPWTTPSKSPVPEKNLMTEHRIPAPSADDEETALGRFTVDLTEQARSGRMDPIVGRDAEIRQVIDILLRRRQNNPILTGEAGVGKTAVVEGFALRVAQGQVPPPLRQIAVRTLDLGLLQAGAGVKGEFEARLKGVIDEVDRAPMPIILFIDEAHTLIGAGRQAGQSDAANLLKPALARGELRTIAATTWTEYKKYIEKDPALARRFQVVKIEEPDEEAAIEMLRGVAVNLEKHHQVRILDEAVAESVRLSHRYITGRFLPDKAISVLDTACARVAIGQNSTPPALEDAQRSIEQMQMERRILEREQTTGYDHGERIATLKQALAQTEQRRTRLEAQWDREQEAVEEFISLRTQLEEAIARQDDDPETDFLRHRLEQQQQALTELQGDVPMVPIRVDAHAVASVVSGWTGIPIGKMLTDEIGAVLNLKNRMAALVVGQDPALEVIARSIRTSRANLVDPEKPIGVFLLVGPSGIGKTETAVTLAEILYGGRMVQLNMSEYQEAYSVSKLKGAPPGYVGYGRGGVLTEALRRNPYTVVLLDEIEKAHPDVIELFFQVFDKGHLEDAEGIEINFKNAIILLTSNIGTDEIMEACRYGAIRPDPEALADKIRPVLLEHFSPAFLGRLVTVPFYPLGEDEIDRIVRIKLTKIEQRFAEHHRATFTYDDDLVRHISYRCTEVDSGARVIDHILTQTLLPDLSSEVLLRMAEGERFSNAHVSVDARGNFTYTLHD